MPTLYIKYSGILIRPTASAPHHSFCLHVSHWINTNLRIESGADWGGGSCPHLPTRGDANVGLHDCMLRISSDIRVISSTIESMMVFCLSMGFPSTASGEQLDVQPAVSTTVIIISSSSIQQYNSYSLLIDFDTPE